MTTQRQHVSIGKESRSCQHHGAYEATLWDLQPKPAGYPHLPGRAAIADFLKPFWSSCPKCDSEAQAGVDAKEREIMNGETEAVRRAQARIAAAGIPARFLEATLWNWQHGMDRQKAIWSWAREYAGQFDLALSSGRSAVFFGATGTGKTHLAIGLLKHILEKGGTGRYCTVMTMLGRIKASYAQDSKESEAQAIAAFTGVDMLVVDEVGRALETGYTEAQFFNVLNTRYGELRPVLLVSNLNKQKLSDYLGDAVFDRMREAGGGMHVFDWASQRSAKKSVVDSEE